MKTYVYIAAACVLAFFLPHCMLDRLAGGTGEETTNGRVCGVVLDSSARPVKGAVVAVLPEQFDPVKDSTIVRLDTTDAAGRFDFTGIDTGVYNCFATHGGRAKCALTHNFGVRHDTVELPSIVLLSPGAVRVRLPSNVNTTLGYVFIPGTEIVSYLNGRREWVVLDSVPSGSLPSVVYAEPRSPVRTVIRYDVPVAPAQTVSVSNPGWLYEKHIRLNTTATGAGVAGTVLNFPVLIRLTAKNFPFSEARLKGEDIRFARADSVFLPCEIKQWDAAGQSAELWVKVDTVFGNDSAQSIVMYWGNSDAAGSSSSPAVFDTANGFAGVWHCGENGDSIYDATVNAFNGKKYGSTMVPGVVGSAESFAKGNFIRIPGLLNRPSSLTLSAWVRYDTSEGGQDIVSIGDAAFIRADDIIDEIGTAGAYHNDAIVNDSNYAYVSSGRFLAKTGWHYLVFSINTVTQVQTFYIDGVQSAISHDVNPIYYAGLGTDTYIGKHGNGKTNFNFIGQIDEVRVNKAAVDADWIRLCFMNQKTQDALLIW